VPELAPDNDDSMRPARFVAAKRPAFRTLTRHPLFPAIHGRLIARDSTHQIAAWIQQRVGPDDALGRQRPASLARMLQRFRRMLPHTTYLPRTFIQELIRDAEIYVDDVQELAGLIAYQKQPITEMIAFEETFGGMKLPATRDEIKLLADLLRQMRDTKIALGVESGVLPDSRRECLHPGSAPPGPSALELFLSRHPERIQEVQPMLALLAGVTIDDEVLEAGEGEA
jgi:hypothetical protein